MSDTQQREYRAILPDGTQLELVITYSELGNYSTARCGKISNSLSNRYYDAQWAYEAMTGSFEDMLTWTANSTDVVRFNAGNPVEWQEVNRG